MFKKSLLLAAVAASACACAFAEPRGNEYRSSIEMARGLKVSGDLVDLTEVRIYVNGRKVIDGQVALLHGDGEFRGQYEGRPVAASCSTRPGRAAGGTSCEVSIDEERRTLSF
jgi:hypothetical protein